MTYVDEKDRCHDPGEVVWKDLEKRLEHAFVVDDMPKELLTLLF